MACRAVEAGTRACRSPSPTR